MIYLDHNSTMPVKPEVIAEMVRVMELGSLNPSSTHAAGRLARKIIEAARGKVAGLVNAKNANVIFTSGGTEANNLALRGTIGYRILALATEHVSVLKATDAEIIAVEENGQILFKDLEAKIKNGSGKFLVSVALANNETGVIQDIKKIAELVHLHGGIIHSDASQAIGKIKVDMEDLGVDMLTISAHKFGGPQGSGALLAKKNIPLNAVIFGGGQELGLRSGTENVAAIAGFGVACDLAGIYHAENLRNKIEAEIKAFAPEAIIAGEKSPRLGNTSLVIMPGVKAETQLIEFDLNKIAVSSGSACSSGKVKSSHVLEAMGYGREVSECAVRVSLGNGNTEEEINKFIETWKGLYSRAGKKLAA